MSRVFHLVRERGSTQYCPSFTRHTFSFPLYSVSFYAVAVLFERYPLSDVDVRLTPDTGTRIGLEATTVGDL